MKDLLEPLVPVMVFNEVLTGSTGCTGPCNVHSYIRNVFLCYMHEYLYIYTYVRLRIYTDIHHIYIYAYLIICIEYDFLLLLLRFIFGVG